MKQFLKNNLVIILIVIIALLLRIYNLTSISLWHDEAFSALLIKYPFTEMMHRIALDVHPPLYYILLRFWHYIFGDGLGSLRGFSVLFSLLTIITSYILVLKTIKSKWIAIVSALLLAINPFQIQYVSEARMYTLGAFLVLATTLSLIHALDLQKLRVKEGMLNISKLKILFYFLLYSFFAAASMYTHYYLLFYVAAIGLYALIKTIYLYKNEVKQYLPIITAGIIQIVLFLPWLKTFLFQFKQVGSGYWIPQMDRWSIPDTLWRLLISIQADGVPTHKLLLFASALVILLLGITIYNQVKKRNIEHYWLLLLNFIAPFAGSLLFLILAKLQQQNSSVYLVRYFLFNSSFLLILTALAIYQINIKKVSNFFILILIALNFTGFILYWSGMDIKNKEGMAAAAQFLNSNVESGHKLYVASSFEYFNFKYYNQTPVTDLKLFSGGITQIEKMPHYAGTALLNNEDLLPDFNIDTKNGDKVWILWTNAFGAKPPETPTNWAKIDEKSYPDVRPYPGTDIKVTEYVVN